jgi:hypothetical protein
VYQLFPNEIKLVYSEEVDSTFEEEYINKLSNRNQVVIKGPIKLGNTWTDESGVESTITGVDVEVITPARVVYNAIEITRRFGDFELKSYFASTYGFIKSETLGFSKELLRIDNSINKVKDQREVSWFLKEFFPIDLGPTHTDLTPILKKLGLTKEELLSWMELTSETFKYIPSFSKDRKIPDGILAQGMARYCLEVYKGKDREDMFITNQNGNAIAVKKEAVGKMAKLLLDQKINEHKTTKWDGPIFTFNNDAYYFDGYSYHGFYLSYINEIKVNGDGSITVDYDVYYFLEDDVIERYHWLNSETFLGRVYEKPSFFGTPIAKAKTTYKKIIENNTERLVIIENLK